MWDIAAADSQFDSQPRKFIKRPEPRNSEKKMRMKKTEWDWGKETKQFHNAKAIILLMPSESFAKLQKQWIL